MPDTDKDHKDPLDLHGKPDVLEAQRAADVAWEQVEAYRKQVDAARRAAAQSPAERGERAVLRHWTAEENQEFDQRHAAAVAASQARTRIMAEVGVTSTFEAEFEMRKHSREVPADSDRA